MPKMPQNAKDQFLLQYFANYSSLPRFSHSHLQLGGDAEPRVVGPVVEVQQLQLVTGEAQGSLVFGLLLEGCSSIAVTAAATAAGAHTQGHRGGLLVAEISDENKKILGKF